MLRAHIRHDVAFPAYAGMNRTGYQNFWKQMGVPRVCGDEPLPKPDDAGWWTRSPRMRG